MGRMTMGIRMNRPTKKFRCFLWNGSPVDRVTLQSYFMDAAAKDPQPEIHLNPNKLAKYDIVAKVLADAQRLGVKKIGFTGLDQYMQ